MKLLENTLCIARFSDLLNAIKGKTCLSYVNYVLSSIEVQFLKFQTIWIQLFCTVILKVTLSTKYSAPISVGLWSPQKIQFLYKFYVLNILVVYLHFAHALSYSLRSRGKLEDCKTRMYNSIKSVLKQFERVFTEYDYPSLLTTSCSISIFYQIPPGCLKKSLFIHDNCDLYFLILTIFFG